MEEQHTIPAPSHFCPNCQSPLMNEAGFCHKCGQKNTNGRLTVKELFSQFFDKFFNLDSKIFRTLGAVFIPGKLTNAFLSGQRLKYYHPLRLFLVLMIISLATIKSQGDFSSPTNLKKEHIDKLKERKRLMAVLDTSIMSVSEKTKQAVVLESLDSLSKVFYKNSGKRIDSININDAIKITNDFDFYIALEDFGKYSSEEILENYEVKGFFKRLMVRQKIKMIEEDTGFVPFVMGKVTWVIFIVLLLLSLIFKILYFRSDILYLEHLIFGIHLNCFFLILVSLLNLVPWDTTEKLVPYTLLTMAIYFFIALKRVYKQTYFKTILKFIVFVVCNFFLFIFGVVVTVLGSFLIF